MNLLEKPVPKIWELPIATDSPPVNQSGERDLIAQARLEQSRGESNEAFTELYRRYPNRVYRFILIRTGSIPDAQDITAQTFLTALKGLSDFRSDNFRAWLFGIARHKLVDHFRRQKPGVSLNDLTDLNETGLELAESAPSLEEIVSEHLSLERVADALHAIAPDRAEALSLHIFGGLSMAEVGTITGRSESAAKMLVHRALSDLRQRLKHLNEDESHE